METLEIPGGEADIVQSCFNQEVIKAEYPDADAVHKACKLKHETGPARNSASFSASLEGDKLATDRNLMEVDASNRVEESSSADEDLKFEETWKETCAQGLARKDKVVKFCWGRCGFHGRPFADTCTVRLVPKLIDSIKSGCIYSLTELIVNLNLMQTTAQRSQLPDLLVAVAPTIKVLSLYNIQYWLQPYSENTEFSALRNLELRFSKFKKPLEIKWALDFLIGFVQRAPALQNLSLKGSRMMSHFVHVMNTANCRNVERLFVSSEVSNRHLLRLADLRLQLKALCLEISVIKTQKYPIKPTGMKTLLQSTSAHLEELMLQGVRKSPNNLALEIEFPKMPQLETFGLLMFCPFVKLLNFSIATQFPQMKNFHLTLMHPDLSDLIVDANVQPATSVEALALSCPMDATKLLCLAKVFPNLKKLAIEAAPNLLENLRCTCLNVDDLNLMFDLEDGVDADSILTEYSPETCKNMNAEADIPQTLHPNKKQLSNFLLDLKTLTLATSGELLGLSDVGCQMILQKFPHLRCLNIWGKHEITDSTMKRMREKFTVL